MSKKVLIIDDSKTVRTQVREALAPAGFEVVEADDGIEGVDAINRLTDLIVVLCDVNMPRMGGIEVLETVKRELKHANLPVVMLTTEGNPELILRAKAAGAKGWIVKPFKPAMLVSAVRKFTSS